MQKLIIYGMELSRIITFAANFFVTLFFGSSYMSLDTLLPKNKLPKKILQKRICKSAILFLLTLMPIKFATAEIIDLQKNEEIFGDWKVYCETDVMMDNSHCKIAAKFFDNSSVITIEPTAKFFNQLFVVIPQIEKGSFVKIRVDKYDIILSKNVDQRDFGLIVIDDVSKNELYNQMKKGDFLFLRFNIKSRSKELTVKLSLKDFRSALSYYNSKVFHQ